MRVLITFFTRFLPYIKGHFFLFLVAIFGSLLTAAATALIAYAVNPLLSTLGGKTPQMPLFSFESMAQNHSLALLMAFLIVALYFMKDLGAYIQGYFMSYIGGDIVRQVQNTMLNHILSLDLRFFNKMRSGELVSRVTNDINAIRTAVSSYIAEFIREIITILGLICVVIYQNPRLAFFGLIIIPLAAIPLNLIFKKIKQYLHRFMQQNADITAKLAEIFNNIEMIKANNSEKMEAALFKAQNLSMFKISMKSTKYSQLTAPLMEFLGAIGLACIIYLAITEINSGNLTMEEFGSFATALFMIYTPIKRLINIWSGMQGAIVASDRIYEILNITPQICDGEITLKKPIESIEFKGVSFKYENIDALHNINLIFRRNEITALVGKSGSGKSTLVNLILRLYEANSGEVLINARNIRDYTQKSLRENIAIVTQRIFIFNDSIAKNVAYGQEIDESRVIAALKSAQMWDFVEKMPRGIHSVLDEFGANLSGGQRQRIAIARALYKNPEILILDEITSALDSATEDLIKGTIDAIRKDKIIILIAHRPSTIELANQVVKLNNGEVEN